MLTCACANDVYLLQVDWAVVQTAAARSLDTPVDPGNCCHHPVASRVDTVTFQRERSRYIVRTHITIDVSRSTFPLRSARVA